MQHESSPFKTNQLKGEQSKHAKTSIFLGIKKTASFERKAVCWIFIPASHFPPLESSSSGSKSFKGSL
ncbi:type IV secretory pathway VirJ component [Salibacterium salarium]|nr:type IV secretory pathway VirJ component [Salibacterium salarium]